MTLDGRLITCRRQHMLAKAHTPGFASQHKSGPSTYEVKVMGIEVVLLLLL